MLKIMGKKYLQFYSENFGLSKPVFSSRIQTFILHILRENTMIYQTNKIVCFVFA